MDMRQKALEKFLDFIIGLNDQMSEEKGEPMESEESEGSEKPAAKLDILAIGAGKKPEDKEMC